MRLDADMQRVVLEQRLGFVATVTPDGLPNVSPKGTLTVFDDEHLVFADIASPRTVRNIDASPLVEVNVVDPFVRKGYRFRGRASVHRDGERYERGLAVLAERGYTVGRDRVRSIVVIEVERAAPLVSPAYDDAGVSEDQLAEQYLAHHSALRQRRGTSGP